MPIDGRIIRRIWLIVANSFNSLVVPIFSVLISLLVVRTVSVELWGSFVGLLIIVQFAAHILGWGNKEYLLRAFSREPQHIAELWQSSLITRLILFGGVLVVLIWVNLPPTQLLGMTLWTLLLVLQQAYDAVIVYRRDFLFSISVEVIGVGVLLVFIWQRGSNLNLDDLLSWHVLVTAGKTLALTWRSRWLLWMQWLGRVQWSYFVKASSFFLLGLSGMLGSRIDLYSVNALLSAGELAQYQVFIGLMLYLQALAAFIITPFIKTIYQLDFSAIVKLSWRFLLLSLLLVPSGVFIVAVVLSQVYRIDLPFAMYGWGVIFVIPMYYSLPIIYGLYKAERQRTVLLVNLLGIPGNLGFNLILIPRFGILGALMATTLISLGSATFYFTQSRSLLKLEHADKNGIPVS